MVIQSSEEHRRCAVSHVGGRIERPTPCGIDVSYQRLGPELFGLSRRGQNAAQLFKTHKKGAFPKKAHRRCSSGSPKLFRRRLVRDKDGDGSLRHPPRTLRYHYARHFLCGWRSAIRSGTGAVWTDGADAGARSRFPVDYLKKSLCG